MSSRPVSRATPRARDAHDELLKLQEENAALKRHNLEQGEKMRQLGVQMQRIRADMASSGGMGKDVPLAERARAAQLAAKDEKIAQLQMELAQRDAANRKLAQQLALYKQTSTVGGRSGGRYSSARPALKKRPPNIPVPAAPAAFRPRPGSARSSRDAFQAPRTPPRSPPPQRTAAADLADPEALTRLASAAAVPALSEGVEGEAGQLSALLKMLQEKDRQIEEMRKQNVPPTASEPGSAAEAIAATARVAPPGACVPSGTGSSETVQMLELRRSLKERTAQLTLLTQRYDHLNGRFEAVRANHEKVLAQMNDLNRIIRDERTENTRLRQDVQRLQIVQETADETKLVMEQLRSEKIALEEENRRVLARVFSEDEASELSVARQQVIQRDAEIKRLKSKLKEAEDKAKISADANAASDTRLAAAHGERDSAKRSLHRAQAELNQRQQEIEALERRVAHLVGDMGVSPQHLEQALAIVRDTEQGAVGSAQLLYCGGSGAPAPASAAHRDVAAASAVAESHGQRFGETSRRLHETDLSKLGLPPFAKKQVHEILIQNNELNMQLEKTESLLKISQRLADTLRAELDATKRREAEERARLQKQLALRTQELTSATRNALRHSEMVSAMEAQRKDYLAGRMPRAPLLPHAHDVESIAGSIISEGTHSELDVGPDENMFELRVVSASLNADYFGALPSTFVSMDFFQHDTQATPMRQGLQPEFDFTAQYVLSVDDLFLHYLATAAMRLELNQSWGVECQVVAMCDVPLRELLQSPRGKVSKYVQLMSVTPPARAGDAPPAPRPVGSLVFEMRMRRRIDVATSAFLQQFPDVASLALTPVLPGQRDKEVVITIVQATALRLRAHGLRALPYVHFEFYDFGEQETATSSGSDPRFEQEFRFAIDLDANLNEYLKQEVIRFSVFDENEDDAAGLLGFGTLPLGRLLTNPRLDEELPLQDASLQPAGNLSVRIELRDSSQPRPISLKRSCITDTDSAAAAIQSAYRGRIVRRDKGGAAEKGADISLRLFRLELHGGAMEDSYSAAWVEIDLLDLTPAPLKTKQARLREAGCSFDFSHTLPVKSGGSAAAALRRALEATDDKESDVFFNLMGVTPSGASKLIGNAYLNIKELWTTGTDLDEATIPVRGAQAERPIGSLVLSASVVAACHRAIAASSVRIDVRVVSLSDPIHDDTAVNEIWVEVELPELSGSSGKARTNALPKSTHPCDFKHTHLLELQPGSAAAEAMTRAISSPGGHDADVLFMLKGRGSASTKPRDLGQGVINLATMLRDGRDLVQKPLRLTTKGGDEPIELTVTLLAVEALRRLRAPHASVDAVRIDIGKLTLVKPLLGDRSIDELWADVEWVDGAKVLETKRLRAADAAPSLFFEFSGQVAVEEGSQAQILLGEALSSSDEQKSDLYFNLNTNDAQRRGGSDREVAQAYVNLHELLRSGQDIVKKPIDLITEAGVPVGTLEVSVAALPVLKRSMAPRSSAMLKVEIGTLQLSPTIVRDATVTELWVEVDLPGDDLATAEQQTSRHIQKRAAKLDCGYSVSIPLSRGSRALATLSEALTSQQPEDADIFFALKARASSGTSRQLGEGYVSLRTILETGRELSSVPVALSDDAGTLTVSVTALEVLRLAGAVISTEATTTCANATRGDAGPSLTLAVSALTLSGRVMEDESVGEVWVEVDLFDISEGAHLRTERSPKRSSLTLAYSYSVAVPPGSRAREVLRSALASSSEGDDDVYFMLKAATSRGGSPRTLGEAYISLREVLKTGREIPPTALSLSDQAGTVTVALTAVEALRAASEGLSTVDAVGAVRPATTTSLDDNLVLRLETLDLTDSLRVASSQRELVVSFELLGQEQHTAPFLAPTTMPHLVNQQFAIPIDPHRPATQDELRRVLQSSRRTDADVIFRLSHGRVEQRVVFASGVINLQDIWSSGRDLQHHSVRMTKQSLAASSGEESSLVVSTDMIRAFSRLLEKPAAAGAPTASSFLAGLSDPGPAVPPSSSVRARPPVAPASPPRSLQGQSSAKSFLDSLGSSAAPPAQAALPAQAPEYAKGSAQSFLDSLGK